MSAAIQDEDLEELAISITPNPRRSSARPPEMSSTPATAPPVNSDQRTVQRMGQYDVHKTLGEGSFGKVKLATHIVSGQVVALKIINRKRLVTRDMAGRIEREIAYLQLLRHPHIIKLYTVITTPVEIVMVLEYAGHELFDYIVNHGKLPEPQARKFFQQIVCAVEYCHRHKIVHRDLKPENLLLDEHFNVKIADFGLSNIMTDGNFLKTSCGSPNYAAPEVISGKLYAGPEVDVWSCGVILYVLLVGRLPFDDEYIPTLFKKIAAGNYSIPNYLSPGAVTLIRRMLQVNAVNRITIPEIRLDPWFVEDLPAYLALPKEEFLDTGIDPNKAIDPKTLATSQPVADVQELHDKVVIKLGKTMGYAQHDVKEALAQDEPSAIKDAYLIVRENEILRENPLLASEKTLQPFLAESLTNESYMNQPRPSVMSNSTHKPPPSSFTDQERRISTSSSQITVARSHISSIAVLPSSLPEYHKAYMKGHPKKGPLPEFEDTPHNEKRTDDQRADTRRSLRPNFRAAAETARARPEPMTSIPTKKSRPTKWQFGIRSRNQPAEAMLAIYKALSAMGADWEAPRIRKPGGGSGSRSRSGSTEGRSHSRSRSRSNSRGSSISSHSSNDDNYSTSRRNSDRSISPNHREPLSVRNNSPNGSPGRERGRGRKHYNSSNDWGYSIPEDPWVINARFRKDGMFPPGVAHPSSTHSSRVNLHDDPAGLRRRSSTNTSHSSLNHVEGITSTGSIAGDFNSSKFPGADEAVHIYMSIQLYSIERDFFVVDFKCAGYERLVNNLVREVKANNMDISTLNLSPSQSREYEDGWDDEQGVWRRLGDGEEVVDGVKGVLRERTEEVGAGRSTGEKRATSPFPFLDVASSLILQLSGE